MVPPQLCLLVYKPHEYYSFSYLVIPTINQLVDVFSHYNPLKYTVFQLGTFQKVRSQVDDFKNETILVEIHHSFCGGPRPI
jgi:hypothetical protein